MCKLCQESILPCLRRLDFLFCPCLFVSVSYAPLTFGPSPCLSTSVPLSNFSVFPCLCLSVAVSLSHLHFSRRSLFPAVFPSRSRSFLCLAHSLVSSFLILTIPFPPFFLLDFAPYSSSDSDLAVVSATALIIFPFLSSYVPQSDHSTSESAPPLAGPAGQGRPAADGGDAAAAVRDAGKPTAPELGNAIRHNQRVLRISRPYQQGTFIRVLCSLIL